MGSNGGNRSGSQGRAGNPLVAGILVGMVIGVAIAAALAWYLMKSPTPFLQKSPVADKLPQTYSAQSAPVATAPAVTDKPRFEFYKVLTDKQESVVALPDKRADKSKSSESKAVNGFEPSLLQAGSFRNADDADKLKAKLAMLGMEANVQSAAIPDRGVWYRVRLGPYKSEEEINRARTFLKQNGVDSTPMRPQ
ncbi:MAG: SPOR domain-containing protein [Gallionella sp.]